jgi:hypothetical protein
MRAMKATFFLLAIGTVTAAAMQSAKREQPAHNWINPFQDLIDAADPKEILGE